MEVQAARASIHHTLTILTDIVHLQFAAVITSLVHPSGPCDAQQGNQHGPRQGSAFNNDANAVAKRFWQCIGPG